MATLKNSASRLKFGCLGVYSHRKDMSPLTQGLNYRSACD